MIRVAIVMFLVLGLACGQSVQEIAIPHLVLYNTFASQYDRYLTDEDRSVLNQFTPGIDFFGHPFRYGLTVMDIKGW